MRCNPEITIIIRPEDIPVRDNFMCTDDPEQDRKDENEIINRLNDGDVWAWCLVEVRAEFRGLIGHDSLGCCCYANEDEFKADSGYYEDMVGNAVAELAELIADLQGVEINKNLRAPKGAPVVYKGC